VPIVFGFFGSDIGDEDAVDPGVGGRRRKFFESHLKDGIVVAEQDDRNFGGGSFGAANFADQIDYLGERGAVF
jgi:hypothetical protein